MTQTIEASKLTLTQERILALYDREGAMTDTDLVEEFFKTYGTAGSSSKGIEARRSELVKLGLVKETGRRQMLRTGRTAKVWSLVEDAA